MEKHASKSFVSKFSFAMGNLGHANFFYGLLGNWFIVFVTAGLFSELAPAIANKF